MHSNYYVFITSGPRHIHTPIRKHKKRRKKSEQAKIKIVT